MAAGCKRESVWEYFNEVPLPMDKEGMSAKCKHHNKEIQGLVAQMKHHEKYCDEDDKKNMSEQAGSSDYKQQEDEDE